MKSSVHRRTKAEEIILARQQQFELVLKCIQQAASMDGDHEFIYYAKACYWALQNNQTEAI